MRRIAVVAAVIAVSATLGGSASGKRESARAGSPITIGYVIGLTGGASSFDLPTFQGAKVAVADINAAGGVAGHPLKLISVDTQSKFTNGTSGAQQAIEKGAQIIVPSCDYDFGGPAARQGNKQGVLVIACAGDPLMGRTGTGPLTFNIFPPAPAEGADEAQFAIQKGWKNAYELVDTSIQYSKRGCQYMEEAYKHLGGTIVGKDSFLNSDPSIAPQVSRMRGSQSKAQVLLLCSYVPGVSTAIKQIRAGGINLPIVAQIGVDGRFILKSLPDLSNLYYGSVGFIFGEDHAPPTLATLGKQFVAHGGSKSTTEWAVVAGLLGDSDDQVRPDPIKGRDRRQEARGDPGKGKECACADRQCHLLVPMSHPDQSCGEARTGAERQAERERRGHSEVGSAVSVLVAAGNRGCEAAGVGTAASAVRRDV